MDADLIYKATIIYDLCEIKCIMCPCLRYKVNQTIKELAHLSTGEVGVPPLTADVRSGP